MPPSTDEEDAYFTSIRAELESAIGDGVDSAIAHRVEEPVKWVGNFMLRRLAAERRSSKNAADRAADRLPELAGLASLRMLDLRFCSGLEALPELVGLASLQELHLSGCSGLEALPELAGLASLQTLNLYD